MVNIIIEPRNGALDGRPNPSKRPWHGCMGCRYGCMTRWGFHLEDNWTENET